MTGDKNIQEIQEIKKIKKTHKDQYPLAIKAYLVGGAVRDELLGLPLKDRDWVVIGETPESMKALGFQQVGRDFPVFLHPKTHEEYALARTEKKTHPGHQGFSCNSDPSISLEEDLLRRDLTINAIAKNGKIYIDPFDGIKDLHDRVLRHVSPAFGEDPLRVLRVARFLAQLSHFNFCIAPETQALMKKMITSGELAHLSGERVFKEIQKALETPAPEKFFECLLELNAGSILTTEPLTIPTQSPPQTFSRVQKFSWFFHSSIKNIKFNIPHEYQDFCLLIQATPHLYLSQHQIKTAEALVEILNTLDALRRPERFYAWGEFYAGLTQQTEPQIFLAQALRVIQKIDFKKAIQGEKNPKIMIKNAKVKALQEALYQK
jgi:tRNA nucleotidyltransferase/poly(A) polymerase